MNHSHAFRCFSSLGVVLIPLALSLGGCSAGGVDDSSSGQSGDGDSSSSGVIPDGGSDSGDGSGTGDGSEIVVTGTGGDAGDPSCGAERADTEPNPVDVMILLDQSGSMTLDSPNRWDPVTAAMKGFISDPSLRNMRFGLQYFPQGATRTEDPAICNSFNYESPDVEMTSLPQASSALVTSIDAHYFTAAEGRDAPHWGTPTRPALEGTYDYLRSYLIANPTANPILILATDGKPSKLCYNDDDDLDGIDEITAVITEAASMTPPIKTYVIGIGEVERLDDWAAAGGTGKSAFIVNASDPAATQSEFSAAMDEIRLAEVPCDYPIPPGSGGYIDLGEVNVEFVDEAGTTSALAQVPGAASCTTDLDWHYDNADNPSAVVLCPQACEQINETGGAVEVVFGCKTNIR